MNHSRDYIDWTHAFDYDPSDMSRPLIRKETTSSRAQVGTRAGARKRKGYYTVNVAGKRYPLHRVVYEWHNGPIPDKMFIDHLDNNPENNKIENLQVLSAMDNSRKQLRICTNTSGYKGVSYSTDNSKWISQIKLNGVTVNLASSRTKKRAARIYDRAHIQRTIYDTVDVKSCRKKKRLLLTGIEFKLLIKLIPDHVLNFPLTSYVIVATNDVEDCYVS